jgi:hypothetical protein
VGIGSSSRAAAGPVTVAAPRVGWHDGRVFTPVTVIRDGRVRAAGHRDGDAIPGGVIDAAAGVDGLRRTQRFLDRHLNRRHDTRRDAWPDFPRRAIAGLAELPLRPQWEAVGR